MSTTINLPRGNTGVRLDQVFATSRAQGRAALAGYLPVGFPTFSQSLDALHAVAEHADILEIGLPFSDPMLDGPVIQQATARSLANGFRMRHLFEAIRQLSSASAALLVMTYWQPVARYGPRRFADALALSGAAGVILPDLPVEEAGEWLASARDLGLHTVFVVAPNSSDARLARICAAGSGMIYAPAVAGVTGVRKPVASGLPAFVDRLRAVTAVPVGVGIGVSSPAQANAVGSFADAVIVGSELIRRLQAAPGPAGLRAAASFAQELAHGVRQPLNSAA
ncbi:MULTISPECIES: tryptophan synthase subunit alpha [unclassified Streptomyces]|uniref:tryptophan synthase subunit alpha n=1 Tax=unclassified Streptomyces TaxID=2593676 RepID=UPI0033ABB66F